VNPLGFGERYPAAPDLTSAREGATIDKEATR
jgi:hypothetical protein